MQLVQFDFVGQYRWCCSVILNTLTYLHHHCICDILNSGNPTECKHIRTPSHLRTHINLTVGTAEGRERSRTLKALATFHVSQPAACVKLLLPRCTFHTFLKNVCFFTWSREWIQCCIVCLTGFVQLFGDHSIRLLHLLVQFVLCPVISFSAVQLKIFFLPVSIYVYMG